jgi:hypothetical protein
MKIDQEAIQYMVKRAQRFGKVVRSEIIKAVGISAVYASQMVKDETMLEKQGLRRLGKGMESVIAPDPDDFFSDLDEASHHSLPDRDRILGGKIPLWVSPGVRNHMRADILQPLCRAIESGQSLLLEYVGMGAGEKKQIRRGEPIGFSHIQGRWHVRAWLYPSPTGKTEGWRDLVLGRIIKANDNKPTDDEPFPRGWIRRLREAELQAEIGEETDLETWLVEAEMTPETRFLSPHPHLTADQKAVVEIEFGLKNEGQKTLLKHEWMYMEKQYISTHPDQQPPQYLLVYVS